MNLNVGIVSSLPTDPVEWKRSYGRTTKSVYVEVEFQPFHVDSLMKVMYKALQYNVIFSSCVLTICSRAERNEPSILQFLFGLIWILLNIRCEMIRCY